WKISKPGLEDIEFGDPPSGNGTPPHTIKRTLYTKSHTPPGMVAVPGGNYSTMLAGIGFLGPVNLTDYWIDRYEVTNRRFKEFVDSGPSIVPLSNFGGSGPARVGANSGIGPFGTFDMAGNVKEWSRTEEIGRRYILGGGWNDLTYSFSWPEPKDPWDRLPSNGFRCIQYADTKTPSSALANAVPRQFRDFAKE